MMQENSFGAELEMRYQVHEAHGVAEQARLARMSRRLVSGFDVRRLQAALGSGVEQAVDAIRSWSAGAKGPEPQCC